MKKGKEFEVLEFKVDREDYERFKRFAVVRCLTLDEALRAALVEGMNRYWSQQLAQIESGYTGLKQRLEEYRRDNETLNRIFSQNYELRRLLGESENK
jgi:hypothetical protein